MSCDVQEQVEQSQHTARIFNIQRYSLHDGSGIRTVVFFKGCPLSCPWCANPESRSHQTTYMRRMAKCLECEECEMDVDECPSGAWELVGTDMTLDEVLAQVAKDDVFFDTSQGGITLSGGEVLNQPHFAIELLTRLKQLGYRTAVETSGHGSTTQLLRIGQLCEEVLFDFKIMDKERAKQVVGLNLDKVLENFTRLVGQGVHVVPRLPLIPGYTLDLLNIDRVIRFLKPFDVEEIHLLPFHQYGANKYQTLGMEYLMKDVAVPTQSEVEAIRSHVEAHGYRVVIGG
ncbi:[formate-C-acetyltransferase]-activating enzyme [Photobacterium rosenbergii]|uniref:[formate-C-acetyltransferase]-activating enzyme n=1 Tax=Photobacterium rosenbergii TaxID=294936 RepID=A0ABU3ZI56_9GAMM|nr:[formate-C-acetyltransferase]-activating enzyme [Photobacterium rosenbergii]MDV5169771.1 [formate-C-acetyltransferase]-activating enzyme [Photobacterium rosenbergii]